MTLHWAEKVVALCLLGCLAGSGCLSRETLQSAAPTAKDPPGAAARPSAVPPASAAATSAAKNANADDSDRGLLAQPDWIRTIAPQNAQAEGPVATVSDPYPRWRHPGLEQFMARSGDRRARLRSFLADKDAVVSANAAAGLARGG
ncbi:MAG: hypothetical protein ABSG68_19875, partial [Thermoguttaceae bacterium]